MPADRFASFKAKMRAKQAQQEQQEQQQQQSTLGEGQEEEQQEDQSGLSESPLSDSTTNEDGSDSSLRLPSEGGGVDPEDIQSVGQRLAEGNSVVLQQVGRDMLSDMSDDRFQQKHQVSREEFVSRVQKANENTVEFSEGDRTVAEAKAQEKRTDIREVRRAMLNPFEPEGGFEDKEQLQQAIQDSVEAGVLLESEAQSINTPEEFREAVASARGEARRLLDSSLPENFSPVSEEQAKENLMRNAGLTEQQAQDVMDNNLASRSGDIPFIPDQTIERYSLGVRSGTEDFANSVVDLALAGIDVGGQASEAVTGVGESVSNVASDIQGVRDSQEDFFRDPDSFLGQTTNSITQFGLGWYTGGAALKGAGLAGKSGRLGTAIFGSGRAGRAAGAAISSGGRGAAADFIAFDAQEERLANLVEQVPSLRNPVTDFLAADSDDGEFEGRMKNVLEGGAIGAGLSLMSSMVKISAKGMKKASQALKSGDTEAAKAAAEQAAEKSRRLATFLPTDKDIAQRSRELWEQAGKPEGEAERFWLTAERQLLEETRFDPKTVDLDSGEPVKIEGQGSAGEADEAAADEVLNQDQVKQFLTDLENPNSRPVGDEPIWNEARMNSPETVEKAIDDMARAIGNNTNILESRKLAEIEEAAEWTGQNPQTMLSELEKLGEQAKEMENLLVAGKKAMHQKSAEIIAAARKFSKTGASEQEKVNLIRQVDLLNRIESNALRVRRAAARTTTSGRITTGAGKAGDIPNVSEMDLTDLRSVIDSMGGERQIDDLIGRLAKAENPGQVTRVQKQTLGRQALNTLNEVWINGLLWGPETQSINILSNAFNTTVLPGLQFVGGAMQAGFGLPSASARAAGKKSMRNALSTYMGLGSYMKDAFRMMGTSFNAGDNTLDPQHTVLDSNQFAIGTKDSTTNLAELGRRIFKNGGVHQTTAGNFLQNGLDVIGNSIRFSGRGLSTTDEFFKQLNYRAKVHANAMDEGIAKGLQGDDLSAYVNQRIANSVDSTGKATDEVAMAYSRHATFTDELDGLGREVQTLASRSPALRFLMLPFTRVPVNMLRRVVDITPGVGAAASRNRKALANGGQEQAAFLGKQAAGAALFVTAYMLAAEGRITGGGPRNPEARDAMKDAGWEPYSIAIPQEDGSTKYVSYQRADPAASVLGLVADYHDFVNNSVAAEQIGRGRVNARTITDIGVLVGEAIARNVSNKTYLQGVSQTLGAVVAPDRKLETFLSSRAASFVPNFLPAFIGDDFHREDRTIVQSPLRKLPGFADDLPVMRNFMGEAVARQAGPFNINSMNPLTYSMRKDDPVMDEVIDLRIGFGAPQKQVGNINLTQWTTSDGQEAYDRFLQLHGEVTLEGKTLRERLTETIQSKDYQDLPDREETGLQIESPRVNVLRRIVRKYRSAAMAKLREEMPELDEALAKDAEATAEIKRFGTSEAGLSIGELDLEPSNN